MNDGAAILAAILDAPADDLPRLAYADWLEERGEAGRAKFIRVQLAFRVQSHYPPWYYTPWDAQHRILPDLPDKRMPEDGSRLVWHRGFVALAVCALAEWQQHGPALCATQPVTAVHLTDKRPVQVALTEGTVGWWRECSVSGDPPEVLPAWLFDVIMERYDVKASFKYYGSLQAALDAMSDAALLWARRQQPAPA